MRDPAFLPAYLDTLWLDTFPDPSVTKIEDAGHYLQEDAHERIVPELVRFVSGLECPTPRHLAVTGDCRSSRRMSHKGSRRHAPLPMLRYRD
jgi:hypothetical protein